MPFAVFTMYTLIGSLVWNTALIGAGYVLRDNWEDVEPYVDYFQYVVLAMLVGAIAWFVWRRFLSPSRAAPERRQRSLNRFGSAWAGSTGQWCFG